MITAEDRPAKAGIQAGIQAGIKVTIAILKDIRASVLGLYLDGHKSKRDVAKTLRIKYPQFSKSTLHGYASACDPTFTSDYVFNLMTDGVISINLFNAIAIGDFDRGSKDIVAEEAIRHPRLGAVDVKAIRRSIKAGRGNLSLAAAIMTARGSLQAHAKSGDVKKSFKFFDGIVKELNDAALFMQSRIEEAIDIVPHSVADSVDVHMDVYHKLTALEAVLSNSLRFIKEARPRYLELVKNHVFTEARLTAKRVEGGI